MSRIFQAACGNSGGFIKCLAALIKENQKMKGGISMKTAYGYKLFRKDKDGNLHALYVNSAEIQPVGKWLPATAGEMTEDGKVKSKLGKLAYRGGWHLNEEAPYVRHIYTKSYCDDGDEIEKNTGRRFRKIQSEGTVWCLVEYETTVDCQPTANERGKNKHGKIIPKNAQLEMVDPHGYYRYKTNPNMFGTWIICGNMRIVRELSHNEVVEKCAEYGLTPLPLN